MLRKIIQFFQREREIIKLYEYIEERKREAY